MSAVARELESALPPGSVEFYDRSGWYISDYLLTDEEIEACIESAERIYRCQYDRVQPWSSSRYLGTFNQPYTDRVHVRVDQFPSFHSDAIRRVAHSPRIAAMAAELLKADEVRYYKDILVGTPAEGTRSSIGWHIDASYWATCVPERMITVYIPLQERDSHNGGMLMISGSQRWVNRSFNMSADFEEVEKLKRKYQAEGREPEFEDMPHRRGQVSFHSSLVIHGAYPNMTREFQHTLVVGIQAKDNRFVPSPLKRFSESLVVNLNDEIGPRLPDGTPDLTNDDFYPVLYRGGGG